MLDRLRSWLSPEPLETTYDGAAEDFRERRADAIADAREELTTIRDELSAAVAELEEGLVALEQFEDDRGPVEDVLGNVATRRRGLVDDLALPEDPEELRDEVEAFLERRADTSRKEAAVLQQVEFPERYRHAVDRFQGAVDRLERFLDGPYDVIERERELDDLVERRRDRLAELEDVEDELAAVDVDGRAVELGERREELESFHDGEAWEEYEALQRDLTEARDRRDDVVAGTNDAVAATGRGLKKLLYAADNGDVTLDADRSVLDDLRDGDTEAVLSREPATVADAASAAAEAATDDVVDGRDRERLLDGLERLEHLAEDVERLTELDDAIAELEDSVAEHEAPSREQELEERIAEAEDALEEARRKRDRLEDRRDELQDTVVRLESRIEAVLDDGVRGEVTVEAARA